MNRKELSFAFLVSLLCGLFKVDVNNCIEALATASKEKTTLSKCLASISK